nr:tyrosine-type recombinase/integrase [uncultured Albidiferax sp.]
MLLHRGTLFLDAHERVALLPTNFIRSARKRLASLSIPRYGQRLCDFCDFVERHNVFGSVGIDFALRAMPLALLEEYYAECKTRGLSANTIRGREITLKAFCKWLTTAESGPAKTLDLYGGIKFLTDKPTLGPPKFVTVSAVKELSLQMHWEDQRVVTHFIFDTGVRVSEVPRVMKGDMPKPEDYPADCMYFPLFVRGSKGPGGAIKPRHTIISRPVLSRISKYHNSKHYFTHSAVMGKGAPAFLNTDGAPLTSDAIEKFIESAYKRGGLNTISAHRLRHGTAYSVLKSEHGMELLDNLIVAKNMLGHVKLETTEIYARVPAPALRRNGLNTASGDILFRFEEAQSIMDATYLPSHKHRRRRATTATRKGL